MTFAEMEQEYKEREFWDVIKKSDHATPGICPYCEKDLKIETHKKDCVILESRKH